MICIIPARKGSKRIKNKNFISFDNKPIILKVIQNLEKFKFFSEIVVSTNSEEIINILKKTKVKIFRRKEKLSDDQTDTKTVIQDVVKKLYSKNKSQYSKIVCVYPTSIFLKLKHLKSGVKKLNNKTPFVFSVKKYSHPINRSFYRDKNKKIRLNFKFNSKTSTKNYIESYHDAAQFYLGWKNSWLSKKNFFDKNSNFVIFDYLESHDIDNLDDLKIAKKLYKLGRNNL